MAARILRAAQGKLLTMRSAVLAVFLGHGFVERSTVPLAPVK